MDYIKHGRVPHEHIIIFDEAQCAWDQNQVNSSFERSSYPAPNMSEPDIIMEIATTDKKWSVTIGLVGEGQEIYKGEEGGIALWNHALENKNVIMVSLKRQLLPIHRTYEHQKHYTSIRHCVHMLRRPTISL